MLLFPFVASELCLIHYFVLAEIPIMTEPVEIVKERRQRR
ncbi:hypothetical protein PM8797T_27277 [Gimesia maris DSM 8797]|nr:hypothetical protein PM8797T_27277 [Gimesia maris DSM 8797]